MTDNQIPPTETPEEIGLMHASAQPAAEIVSRAQAAWRRIEAWPSRYAHVTSAAIRPGATDDQFRRTEEETGYRLPPALRAWYSLADGMETGTRGAYLLPMGYAWLPLERACELHGQLMAGPEEERGLFPIATSDVDDSHYGLHVDAREGLPSYGCLGLWGAGSESVAYPSGAGWPLVEYLEEIIGALEGRRALRLPDGTTDATETPGIDRSALRWLDPASEFEDGMQRLRRG
ncbi:SMI1/KNR4 family protein [Streptomyces sp. NPDC048272]|uniref:SMI1/KNR4 family protein n=1 Tax=Streptomyces sp. NPDC048272 TaxID=3154616 RepID=UPI0034465F25